MRVLDFRNDLPMLPESVKRRISEGYYALLSLEPGQEPGQEYAYLLLLESQKGYLVKDDGSISGTSIDPRPFRVREVVSFPHQLSIADSTASILNRLQQV